MPRKLKVVTTCYGSPAGPRTAAENLTFARDLLERAVAMRPDLVCLPETLLYIGVRSEQRAAAFEPVPGPAFEAIAEYARRGNTWIVAGLPERRGDRLYNVAALINRRGELVGRYDKIHPTDGEIAGGATPGTEPRVFDTELGRIGLAICYDIGWPALWDEMGRQGAELVVWPSAYDGGFPLQTYAWRHFYYVISSVWSQHARMIDITGQVLATTSRYVHLISHTLDLEKQVFHCDYNAAKLPDIQKRYGDRVEAVSCPQESVFTLESLDPALPLSQVIEDFKLETFRVYHARAERLQDQTRPR